MDCTWQCAPQREPAHRGARGAESATHAQLGSELVAAHCLRAEYAQRRRRRWRRRRRRRQWLWRARSDYSFRVVESGAQSEVKSIFRRICALVINV